MCIVKRTTYLYSNGTRTVSDWPLELCDDANGRIPCRNAHVQEADDIDMASSRASSASHRGSASTHTLASSGTTRGSTHGSNRSSYRNGRYEYRPDRVIRHHDQDFGHQNHRVITVQSAPEVYQQYDYTGANIAPIRRLPRLLRNPHVEVHQPNPPVPQPGHQPIPQQQAPFPIPPPAPGPSHVRGASLPQGSVASQPIYQERRPSDSGRENGPPSSILPRLASREPSVATEIRQPSVGRASHPPSVASSTLRRPRPAPTPPAADPPNDTEDYQDLDPEMGIERGLAEGRRREEARRQSSERHQSQDEVRRRQELHERIANSNSGRGAPSRAPSQAPSRVEGYHGEGNGRVMRTETSHQPPSASSSGRSGGSARRPPRDRDSRRAGGEASGDGSARRRPSRRDSTRHSRE